MVPLYGRGKTPTDPRSKSYPGINIPNRPAGQRPETAPPPPEGNPFSHGFGSMGGFVPMANARFGNFALPTAFVGLFPSFPSFNIQVNSFPNAPGYGMPSSSRYGFYNSFHGGHAHGFPPPTSHGQMADYLKNLVLMFGFIVLLYLIC